ncbi:hypothetical protein AB9P05_15720 [Roseivirga sp. BDSF3-8]|uniref:hypothetical protein n=1 Tax=Roseivirga sp. BDSF3-8 TaxID=3241598 RepID=UPI0035327FE9
MKAALEQYAICARHITGGVKKNENILNRFGYSSLTTNGGVTSPDPPIRTGKEEEEANN